jgi:hypothetical protein
MDRGVLRWVLCLGMGLEFKLTDRELPASPAFIHFLARKLGRGRPSPSEGWVDQRSERLLSLAEEDSQAEAAAAADAVMAEPAGRERVARAYGLLCALIIGDTAHLSELRSPFHFVSVIGIPRSGGTYLTAEIYRASGLVPEEVPQALAHDSFPTIGPFELAPGNNGWVVTLKTMAEYLTMVEWFFEGREPRCGKIVVPKKLTQASYAGGFVRQVLGEAAEYLVTVRHPVAACVSTYEKSGGLPKTGLFAVRSNIEAWCRRDLRDAGFGAERLAALDYFDVYLKYWEHYHSMLAITGLAASPALRIVPYGRDALRSLAQHYHDDYGSGLRASEFYVAQKAGPAHPDWIERARPALARVAARWSAAGLVFPTDEINMCW